jgi:hypothetical protein
MNPIRSLAAVLLLAIFSLTSCGGGSGGGGTPPPPPPPPSNFYIVEQSLPAGLEGQAYSVQLTTRGGTGAVTWSLLEGSDAPWATLDPVTGTITGTPDAARVYFVSIRAQDSGTPQKIYDTGLHLLISSRMSVTAAPTDAIRGYPYNWQGQIRGGVPPFTSSFKSGNLPSGINVASDYFYLKLDGTPADLGTFDFTVEIKDNASPPQVILQPITLKVTSVLKILGSRMKSGVVGRAYSDTVPYVNGTPPLTWTIGTSNTGLSIAPDGVVSGTPSRPVDNVFVTVSDSSTPPQSDSEFLWLPIYDVLRVENPVTTLTAHVGQYFDSWLSLSGGVPPTTVVISTGSFPPGLVFADNHLTGTPTAAGTWTLGLHYSDSAIPPQTYDQPVVLTVLPPTPVMLNYPDLPAVGEDYSYQMLAAQGTPPYKWDVKSGVVPPGLSLSQNGLLSGNVVAGADYSFIIRVTDSANPPQSTAQTIVMRILPKPKGRNDQIANATPKIPWMSTDASLSPLEDPAGTIAPDTDYYKLYAPVGTEVSLDVYRRKVNSISWEYESPTDPVLEIVDANGIRFQTCKDPADDKPAGPILVDTTPADYDDECLNDDAEPGVYRDSRLYFKVPGQSGKMATFYAHVLDFQGTARPDLLYALYATNLTSPVTITTDSNIVLVKGVAISKPMEGWGGSGTLAWSLDSGSLPAGISLNSAGTLVGTPTNVGHSVFTVKATDTSSPPIVATKPIGVRVVEPLKFTLVSLPSAQTGVPYNTQIAWTGGTAPFQLYNGVLPPGLTFDETGLLSGIPTTTGSYSLYFNILDANGMSDVKTYSLSVGAGPLYIATTSLPNAPRNIIYSAFVVAAGGQQPRAWQITSGALPPGMSLNGSTGEVRGIPTSTGVFSFTVKVTDANAATSTATLQLTVQ